MVMHMSNLGIWETQLGSIVRTRLKRNPLLFKNTVILGMGRRQFWLSHFQQQDFSLNSQIYTQEMKLSYQEHWS